MVSYMESDLIFHYSTTSPQQIPPINPSNISVNLLSSDDKKAKLNNDDQKQLKSQIVHW